MIFFLPRKFHNDIIVAKLHYLSFNYILDNICVLLSFFVT